MRLAVILAFVALPAIADAPAFRSSAPLTLTGADALQRVALPFEVYRDARPDLADVRILNGVGEEVPYAWAGELDVAQETPAAIELPLFPVARVQPERASGDEVTVRTQDGTLVAVRTKRAGKAPPRAAAYLLDASQVKVPIGALDFDWKAGPGTQVVPLRVEASEDLRTWSRVASAPVVKVESAGQALSQPRVEFTRREAKYFRITWDAPAFALERVRAQPEPAVKPPPRLVRSVAATPGPKAGEYLFDLGARLPVEAFRIVPADANAVVSATVLARDDESAPWRLVAVAPFYRLQREGAEVQSPAVEIGRRPARYWMARFAAGSSSGPPPTLEAQWRSAQLVFVARGERPFSIAFGKPGAAPVALPVANIVPKYERGVETRLAQAQVGAVASGPPPSRWDRLAGELNARRIALWAILLGGVAALAFMAWRLHRQMS